MGAITKLPALTPTHTVFAQNRPRGHCLSERERGEVIDRPHCFTRPGDGKLGIPIDEDGLAGRECDFEDPDGNRLRVATRRS